MGAGILGLASLGKSLGNLFGGMATNSGGLANTLGSMGFGNQTDGFGNFPLSTAYNNWSMSNALGSPYNTTNTIGSITKGLSANDGVANNIQGLTDFNNSWFGTGLAALQGIGGIMNMFTKYNAYKENKKNSRLSREIATYNLNQAKKEYARLQNQRKTLTESFYGRSPSKPAQSTQKNL